MTAHYCICQPDSGTCGVFRSWSYEGAHSKQCFCKECCARRAVVTQADPK